MIASNRAGKGRHAAFVYGQLHDRGLGLKRDLAAARRFYLLAAERGSIAAMLELAGMMRDGEGGPVDIAGQRCWLLRASDLGNATATFALANSLIDNAPTNVTLGLVLLERMAEGGSVEAAHGLGVRYQDAGGVMRDYALAMKWFRRAAEAGNGRAMNQIGTIYDYGQGVPVDHVEARRWYDWAAAKGWRRPTPPSGCSTTTPGACRATSPRPWPDTARAPSAAQPPR